MASRNPNDSFIIFSQPQKVSRRRRKQNQSRMTTPTTSAQSTIETKMRWKRTLTTIAIMVAHNMTPSQCFQSAASTTTTSRESRHFFRSLDDNVALKNNDFSSSLIGNNAFVPASLTGPNLTVGQMPSWLRQLRGHLVEENLNNLETAMKESYYTENESLKLMYAIQEASNGDADKMAGAADFCTILVETMEMSLNTLIAAAFHFCSCVSARELSLLPRDDASKFAPWEFRPHKGLSSFGSHALQIERDAARLKRLEIVALMVSQNSPNSNIASLDSLEAENLRKLFLTEAKDWRALAIRSAACLYRLRGIMKDRTNNHLTPETVRTCREALHIYAPLASRLGMHRLKHELEDNAFKMLYRRQYETVSSLSHLAPGSSASRSGAFGLCPTELTNEGEKDIAQCMQQILNKVQAEMTLMLEQDEQFSKSVKNFSVTARVKEPYSLWRKMLKNRSEHITEVPDAIALRIVLEAAKESPVEDSTVTKARERALCYYAQTLCVQRWKPLEGNPRFKDYIDKPKANGYQSLHYTANTEWEGEQWNLEIQVRSAEMHKVAEFGLASHWDYKARKKTPTTNQAPKNKVSIANNSQFGKGTITSSDAYLRSLQEWHWQHHGGVPQLDTSHSSSEMFNLSDKVDGKLRADRIRARTQRLAPYIEALVEAQSDLARENVFVFMTQSEKEICDGKVVALPAGASVLDAIHQCEREIGSKLPNSEIGVLHNGTPASITSRLRNGDILSMPSRPSVLTAAP